MYKFKVGQVLYAENLNECFSYCNEHINETEKKLKIIITKLSELELSYNELYNRVENFARNV